MAVKETFSLDERELAELERIILDRDEVAALFFLRETIWQRIRAARRRRMGGRVFTPEPHRKTGTTRHHQKPQQ